MKGIVDGLLSREQARGSAAAIDNELDQLSDDLAALEWDVRPMLAAADTGEPFDSSRAWRWIDFDKAEISSDLVVEWNAYLLSLWRHVQLDKDMAPVSVEWRS